LCDKLVINIVYVNTVARKATLLNVKPRTKFDRYINYAYIVH